MMHRLSAVLLALVAFLFVTPAFSQSETDGSALEGKVDGLTERTAALESTVEKLNKLKISGYIQPQWVWGDIDSLGNQGATRNYFTIRRGRIKFQHTTDNVTYVLYPDVTERGVEIKEVWAAWTPIMELSIALGAMNRPFGYEIQYSSSSREVAERSLAEQRLFAGERDLGLQFAVNPTLMEGFTPTLEFGLFNGSDNFGQGPVSAIPGSSRLGFTLAQFVGNQAKATATGADSAFIAVVNKGLDQDALLATSGTDGGLKVNQKELLGHIRLPFLINDEFSFDIGGSWSIGGIAEPTDMIAEYSGTNGALVLKNSGTQADADYTRARDGNVRSGLFFTNRTVFGADAQFYLSVLPIGGTILKTEMYTGQVPFYGSSALFTKADSAAFGAPRASTVLKNVFGYYAMLVQNIYDDYQLAIRYDSYDPNTDVEGADFAFDDNGTVRALRGANASTSFGGDLAQSTLSVAFNTYISGAVRLMLNYDRVMTEEFKRRVNATTLIDVPDPNDDRFTLRMQYKF